MVRRRRLLRVLGAATTGGVLAGCQDIDDNEEPEENDTEQDDAENENDVSPGEVPDRVEFPALSAGEPTYREWIPPRDVAETEIIIARNLQRTREHREDLPPGVYESVTNGVSVSEYFGVGYENLTEQISFFSEGITVYPGQFDRAEINQTLGKIGYEDEDTLEGISFYRHPTREHQFAVGDLGVVELTRLSNRDSDSFKQQALRLFETAAGERSRRHEVSEPFRQFTEAVGWPLAVFPLYRPAELESGLPDQWQGIIPQTALDQIAIGGGRYLAGDRTVNRWWIRPLGGGQRTQDVLRASISGANFAGFAAEGEEVAVRHRERVSEVATVSQIDSTGGGVDPPLVTLSLAIEDGTLVLEHLVGDPIPLEHVTIRGGDEEDSPSGTLQQGERLTIDALPADEDTFVVYSPPHAEGSSTLASTNE